MDQNLQQIYDVSDSSLIVRHRVLRNTYWLLALSMIPTIFGAWLGVAMNFTLFSGASMLGTIAFLAIAFGFIYGIQKNRNS
ncbi:MAG: BAX inhibitor (BI)-1/YccA family protein, partial [Burkholderiaceae bacterium]